MFDPVVYAVGASRLEGLSLMKDSRGLIGAQSRTLEAMGKYKSVDRIYYESYRRGGVVYSSHGMSSALTREMGDCYIYKERNERPKIDCSDT
jgi:hypothetical protein